MDYSDRIIITPFTLTKEQSFREIAADLTIGGAAYGPALAQVNGYTDQDARMPAGSAVSIPDAWYGMPPTAPLFTTTGTPAIAGIPWYWIVGAVAVVLLG